MISRTFQSIAAAGLTLTALALPIAAWAALEIGQPAPDFKVIEFIALSGGAHPLQEQKPALLEQSNKPSKDKNADLDDDITF